MNELNRTIRNIKEAVSIGCNLGIACLVTDRNVSDLTAIADYFCDELGCRSFSFAYSHHLLNSTKVNEYDFQDYINAMCNLFDHAKEKGFYIDQIGRILRGILRKENCLVGCKAGTSQRTFYPDGSETICTKLDLINKTDIKEIATLFPYNNIHCQDCVAFNLCGGGCLWDSQMRPGPCLADPRLCESKQAFTNYVLQDIENELDQMPLAVFQKGKQLEYLEKKYVPML
jgi:radical SAM protein with 4Fe4S-binding SPASM domain